MNIYAEAAALVERAIPFAVATIISAKGSTPRNTAKMLVQADGSIVGTIGGGLAEALIIQDAVRAINEGQARVVEYTLDSAANHGIEMLCGGTISVFIEVATAKPTIVMIGAGHVGLAVGRLVEMLGYRLIVVDDRQEFANPSRYPMAAAVHWHEDIREAIAQVEIDANSYIVIATKDVDLPALEAVIHSEAAYIGMIGSKRKGLLVRERLAEAGVSRERLELVYSPVGLDIGSETPEEIALSIMSEIMKVRNKKTGISLRDI